MQNDYKSSLDQIRLYDLKVEVLIAEMLDFYENDILPVNLSLQGIFERSYSKEIINQDVKFDPLGDEFEEIQLCREGIYDGLPSFASHAVVRKQKNSKHHKEEVTLSSELNEEEKYARLFFNPLEQEIYRFRGQILKYETDFKVSLDVFRDHFKDFIDTGSDFNMDILIPILPLVNSLKGDTNKFIGFLKEKLSIDATINKKSVDQIKLANYDQVPLGEMALGQNSVVDSNSADFVGGISIDINQHDLTFKQSEQLKKMVHFLADLSLSADLTYDVNISVDQSSFILSSNPNKCPILAYNTII